MKPPARSAGAALREMHPKGDTQVQEMLTLRCIGDQRSERIGAVDAAAVQRQVRLVSANFWLEGGQSLVWDVRGVG
jgi:hypothetical protein